MFTYFKVGTDFTREISVGWERGLVYRYRIFTLVVVILRWALTLLEEFLEGSVRGLV